MNDDNDDCRLGMVILIGQDFGKNQRASGSLPCMQKHHHRLCYRHHRQFSSSSYLMSSSYSSSSLLPSGSKLDTRWRHRNFLENMQKYLCSSKPKLSLEKKSPPKYVPDIVIVMWVKYFTVGYKFWCYQSFYLFCLYKNSRKTHNCCMQRNL